MHSARHLINTAMFTVRERHQLEEYNLYFSRRRECIAKIPHANACMLNLLDTLMHERLSIFVLIGARGTPSSLS